MIQRRFVARIDEVFTVGQHVSADAVGRLHSYAAVALRGHGVVAGVQGRVVMVTFLG